MSELRQGFTTGTAAAAAAKAALLLLLHGHAPNHVEVPLPADREEPTKRLRIAVERCGIENSSARAVVRKDAGDDPDVTHGAEIHALVSWQPGSGPLHVDLIGGVGVGRVTLPGLAVDVGEPAINPGPQRQIRAAVREAVHEQSGTARVCIEVPQGRELARKTMNPRLGIVDGISILGTHGIVRPFSHAAWAASVTQALRVVAAQGGDRVVFTTGRKSERLYAECFPDLPARCMIQAADFFAHAMRAAEEQGLTRVHWSLFFGKLVKQAQGFENTHAHGADIDFSALAHWCGQAGAPHDLVRQCAAANTARQVLGLLQTRTNAQTLNRLLHELAARAIRHAASFAPGVRVGYAVFDFNGSRLLRPDFQLQPAGD